MPSLPAKKNSCAECEGRGFVWVDQETNTVRPCATCAARRLQERLAVLSGLLPSELAVSIDDIRPQGDGTKRLIARARLFCTEPWGLWTIWGGPGNAKTMVLQGVVNHFREQGTLAIYVRLTDTFDYIRAGNDPNATEDARERYRQVAGVKVLALDEVDKVRINPWVREYLAALIDDRWRYAVERDPTTRRHTLLAMNVDPDKLFNDQTHILDRLRDGRAVITHNPDPSMRPAM